MYSCSAFENLAYDSILLTHDNLYFAWKAEALITKYLKLTFHLYLSASLGNSTNNQYLGAAYVVSLVSGANFDEYKWCGLRHKKMGFLSFYCA